MIRLVLALIVAALPLHAQTLPEPLTPFVSDFADVLDAETEARLTATLRAAREDPGTEIAVVTIENRAAYGATPDIETFATALFNAWGIGDAARDNGILILVSVGDREMRLELGAGYGPGYDRIAGNVIDEEFLPAFGRDDYARGILAGTEATISQIAEPFALDPTIRQPGLVERVLNGPWLFLLFAAGIVALAARRRLGDAATRLRKCPTCGRRTLSRSREKLRKPEQDRQGEGLETVRCSSCDYHDTRTFPLSLRNSGRGSGFGGGSSSGGGASGRW